MNKMQNEKQKPDHEGNIITHSRKWQELELQIWKVTCGVLHLRKINLKLNPEKCVFGVLSGKLLGFFVSQRGIEANPNKIKV